MSCNNIRVKIFFLSLYFLLGSFVATQAQNLSDASSTTYSTSYLTSPSLTNVQPDETAQKVQPLELDTIIGQFVIGQLLGGVTGFVTGLIAPYIFLCSEFYCEVRKFIGGAVVGFVTGSAFGVYLVGNNSNRKASYPLVLLGDALGFGIGAVIFNQFAENSTETERIIGGISLFSLPVIGAILTYNFSKKQLNPHKKASLINFSPDNKFVISAPSISAINSSPLLNKKFLPTLSIANFKF